MLFLEEEDLPTAPKVFAKFAGVSVTKLRQGKLTEEQFQQAQDACRAITEATGLDPEEWVQRPLLPGRSVTPAKLWAFKPSVENLLDDPESEIARVCPHWDAMFPLDTEAIR